MNNSSCPEPGCENSLIHNTSRDFAMWTCQSGHGTGITIDAAWNRLQSDEIRSIWEGARTGTPSQLRSPTLHTPMTRVDFVADDDEITGNEGLNARDAVAFVSIDERFIWFPSDAPSDPTQVLSGLRKAIGSMI